VGRAEGGAGRGGAGRGRGGAGRRGAGRGRAEAGPRAGRGRGGAGRSKEITLTKALKVSKLDSFDQQMAALETVRKRRAAGNKKAGSAAGRPGKKKCREMAELVEQAQQLYTSQQVQMLLSWFTGDVDETELRSVFAAGTKTASVRSDNVVTMH